MFLFPLFIFQPSLTNNFLHLFYWWSHSSLIWIVFFDFILLMNFHGVTFKTRLNPHKSIVDIKKTSKWQLILIAFMIIMMYYWPAPTIYEQNCSKFMNKILIYFIAGNGCLFCSKFMNKILIHWLCLGTVPFLSEMVLFIDPHQSPIFF